MSSESQSIADQLNQQYLQRRAQQEAKIAEQYKDEKPYTVEQMMERNVSSQLLLHSVNPLGVELMSFVWRYPRFVHAEVMTHRAFSRNASSSRAIPVEKMLKQVRQNPARPEYWAKNQKGMQATEQLDDGDLLFAKARWTKGAKAAADLAEDLSYDGLHKQIANRVVEPFWHIKGIFTMTRPSFVHFCGLRAHKDAQQEFQVLAFRSLGEYLKSTPKQVAWGEWHLPFMTESDIEETLMLGCKPEAISTARCARVSYLTFDGVRDIEKDAGLYEMLQRDKNPLDPAHASPFEHPCQAQIKHPRSNLDTGFSEDEYSGWLQHRKQLKNEFMPDLDLKAIMERKPDWIEL